MTLHEAIALFREHQKNSVRDKTRESYGHLLKNVESVFGKRVLESIGSHDLYQFLITLTEGRAKKTPRVSATPSSRHSLRSLSRERMPR
jgi:Phage integrase, N-terminal SAM-like domain